MNKDKKMKASLKWQFHCDHEKSKVPMADGCTRLESPLFSGGTEKNSAWKLELSQNLFYKDLQLHLITCDTSELSIKYKVSVQCYHKYSPASTSYITSVQGVKVFKMPNDCVVHHLNFIPNNLFKTAFDQASSICITCELEIETICGKCTLDHNDEGIPDFEKLLNDPDFSDITLIASSESFKVNKMILMTRSSVFRAMFEHDMKEKIEDTVTIPDIDPEVMHELLRYIYCGRVEAFDRVDELFRAADKYQIDDLKRKCLEVLCDKITVENAVDLLVMSNSCSDERSKYRITLFIVDNIREVVASSGFGLLSNDALLKMILREAVDRCIP
ncbi:hypothetical protein QAD02_001490 [Eretmocerus hayati]|uniref:Uncharacterized protein n=1 Tax=Eretmocerus hayati TaxID=131215 RepID=A0ACC2NH39_9HYME|nr:hypothetical protein QAD02_001490 [Eretmocerus hayati]